MAKLIYGTNASLDGYIEDKTGRFDFTEPSEEVHTFINDLFRPIGTHLYGRRLYEVMSVWETMHTLPGQTPVTLDFASIWQNAEKIVYSKTLTSVSTAKTRLEQSFDADAVRALKANSSSDLFIGGADLASQAFAAGLVDEIHLFLAPVIVGGGKHALPEGIRLNLGLIDEHRFDSGTVYLHYQLS